MSSAVAELDGILQSMLNLKPPGVSGSKINAITNLCNANVQSESVLIQKIYTHFKKTPGTHKLGVLYVVDSVTRQWVDHAKKSGQSLDSGAPDGTYAAGVTRVTELLPVLMNDIITSAPEDQKAKIKKLVEIWERSNTFPTPMLTSIKEKLDAPRQNDSTTPVHSPIPGFVPLGQQPTNATPAPAPQQDTSAILEALKNIAAKQTTTSQFTPAVQTPNLSSLLGPQNTNSAASTVGQGPSAGNLQSVNPLGSLLAGMSNHTPNQPSASVAGNPLAAMLPQQYSQQLQQQLNPSAAQNPGAGVTPDMQAQFQLIQLMIAQGIPHEQWGTAFQLLNMQNQGGNQSANGGGLPFAPPVPTNGWPGQNADASRDRDGYPRSPPGGQYHRRSRSPGYDRRRERSPRGRRDSPGYDASRGDGRRGNDYRQRSPRRRRSPSPQQNDPSLPPPGPRFLQWDKSLPNNHIKVLSRTLFVGGVTSNEQHLRGLFSKFGLVQTCIVNVDKRHAFIKMINRKDAEMARNGMEEYRDGGTQLRTKWGVGFGPRDCSDYQTGISIIPADRLTEADRKWLLTAEYGGTGGLPIEHGMIVEEPDIEIGAGVSSKAMSRRIPTDKGGQRGPQSSRTGGNGDGGNGRNNRGRDDDRRNDNQQGGSHGVPNNMPFPFPAMTNGMPNFSGFPFSFPQQQNGSN